MSTLFKIMKYYIESNVNKVELSTILDWVHQTKVK